MYAIRSYYAVWSGKFGLENPYIGAFYVLIGLYVITLLLIASLPLPKPNYAEQHGDTRSYAELFAQPRLLAAVTAGVIGYAVMVLVMTATPLAMESCGYTFGSTASIIQCVITSYSIHYTKLYEKTTTHAGILL